MKNHTTTNKLTDLLTTRFIVMHSLADFETVYIGLDYFGDTGLDQCLKIRKGNEGLRYGLPEEPKIFLISDLAYKQLPKDIQDKFPHMGKRQGINFHYQ